MHANNFHLIRFIAAVMVIYGHSYPLMGLGNLDYIQELSAGTFPTAHMGVCIFFSISGYLIAKSLLDSRTLMSYCWKRFLRIMPGLVVVVLFTIFVVGPIATNLPLSDYFSSNATFQYLKVMKIFPAYPDTLPGVFQDIPATNVNGSLWTLAYEVTCYMLLLGFFIILRKYLGYAVLLLFAGVWGSYFLWHDTLLQTHFPLRIIHLNLFDLFNFGLYFVVGSLLYLFRQWLPLKGWIAVVLFLAFVLSYFLSSTLGWLPLSVIGWVRYLFLPYFILYIGFKPPVWRNFEKIGDLSYGLYIYAYPVQQLVATFFLGEGLSVMGMFFISLVGVLPLAWMSWKFIEEPSLRLKNKLSRPYQLQTEQTK
ncbi:acyltransferase family protein [Dyadobacter tibetensis]|uniref:acyltransferase family protein n=1 Tax=Dyadobacter tibetensis TaxID=1211851 RepID=UPI00047066F2|nr:acyltransferase [Dyadobacter tibetensis]